MIPRCSVSALVLLLTCAGFAAEPASPSLPGDRMLADYFAAETARVNAASASTAGTLDALARDQEADRLKLRDMLGLAPWPERTDLKPTVTGRVEHAEFFVEKLHFQSRPGLYVGANLYVPKNLGGKKAPAILYVCGHARVVEDGLPMGNKTGYQHHGAWFARHGYVCLTIDTIQLGELAGLHHGTRNQGMWWWNARGYTPLGVEVWNALRALDYLETRPEVDAAKLGMTGRSGGGAYTWFTAALDPRVKVAVPVAGITDLHNHVIDGKVAGHCDCMFMVNTYRWDFARVAALLAPRPLLIANSDKDPIFPLDGVLRVHAAVAEIYRRHKAADKLGLLITEGPHKDTQDLQVPAFRWFNRFLKGEDPLVTVAAEKLFKPAELKVFAALPTDEITTTAHETFVPAAAPAVPADAAAWAAQREAWLAALRTRSFAGWPADDGEPPAATRGAGETHGAVARTTWEFASQGAVRLPLTVFRGAASRGGEPVRLHVLDEKGWAALAAAKAEEWPLPAEVARGEVAVAYLAPRGIGPTAWSGDAAERAQILRRFMLLGQTLEGMRVWDIRRAVASLREPALFGAAARVHLVGERNQGVNALYASLFTDGVASVELIAPPVSHRTGPDYLNVLRHLNVPQAVALAAERQPVKLTGGNPDDWTWAATALRRNGWPADRLAW